MHAADIALLISERALGGPWVRPLRNRWLADFPRDTNDLMCYGRECLNDHGEIMNLL